MIRLFLTISTAFIYGSAFCQAAIDTLLSQGVDLNERGYYEEAIIKYDSVLMQDKDNYLAHYEKSFTLMDLKKYEECIRECQYLLKEHKGNKLNAAVYISYGSCLDYLGKKQEAVKIFNRGISEFPNTALLYFNKAVTLFSMQEDDIAIRAIKQSLALDPLYASSHHILGRAYRNNNRVLSLLATLVFFAIEPQGQRAKATITRLEEILGTDARQTGERTVTVTIPSVSVDKKAAGQPDYFGSAEVMLSLNSALNFHDEHINETPVQRLQRNLSMLVGALEMDKKNGKGFGWEFYVPFILDMNKKNYLETLCHIIYAGSDDTQNAQWLKENKKESDAFYQWLKTYKWPVVKSL